MDFLRELPKWSCCSNNALMHSTWFITRPYCTLWGRGGGGGGNKVRYALETVLAADTSPKRCSLQGRRQKGRRKKRKGRGNWGEKESKELFSSSLLFSVYATRVRVPKKWSTHTQKHRLTIICVGGWISWIKNDLHSKFKNSKEKFPTCKFYFKWWLICLLECALKQPHSRTTKAPWG